MTLKEQIVELMPEVFLDLTKNQTIYKYESFNTALCNIIVGGTFMFTHPSNFNDPFDCCEYLFKPELTDQMLQETVNRSFSTELNEKLEVVKQNLRESENVAITIKQEKDKYRLSCFSKKRDKVLMWSHYADKHNGICVGFKFPYDHPEKFVLCNAKYLKKIEPLDGNVSFFEASLHWITSKSKLWCYEDEVRAIFKTSSMENLELLNFDRTYINEILFGCNVSIVR